MIDPADQKASDEAIKRNTNLTPTEVRQSLNATAIDFQRRVDAGSSITPTVSTPQIPAEITSRETRFDAQPVVLPTVTSGEEQNPFPPTNQPAGTGTDSNPYVMGTNRTTTFPTPADDTWDIATGPSPGTGGPYDGVIVDDDFDIWQGTGPGDTDSRDVDLSAGGSVTITSVNVYYYRRRKTFDSLGNLVHVGPQELINSIPQGSIVTFS